MSRVVGILLAAGEGRRMGQPKALLRLPGEQATLLERGIAVLRQGGCDVVIAVVGAAAEQARPLAVDGDLVVEALDWHTGQSASLRAGLEAASTTKADVAVIHLVDLPDVGPDIVRRLLAPQSAGVDAPQQPWRAHLEQRENSAVLARAGYRGVPGHPVILGRDHWPGVLESAAGDSGARDYLAAHDHTVVECGDLATGRDVDTPADL